MLQQRQQHRRLEAVARRACRQPGEDAGRGIEQRLAAGIVVRKLPAVERGHHAARQRAVRRHQRRGAVELVRLAQRHRNRQRFHFRVRRGDDSEAVHGVRDARGDGRVGETLMPLPGGARWPHRFGGEQLAAAPLGRAERRDVAAFDVEAFEQCLQGELRMIRRRWCGEDAGRGHTAADAVPRGVVEIGI